MKSYTNVLLLAALLGCSGCSIPDGIRGHILQPTDRALPAYEDNLVILDVRIASDGGALRLYDVDLRDTATGSPWRFPLFANSIMKTKAVPFEQRDGEIQHTIVLDLPAGTYEVLKLEFRDYRPNLAGSNVVRTFVREPPAPLFLGVVASAQPQYLGTLEIAIDPYVVSTSRDGTSQMLGAAQAAQTEERMSDPSVVDRMNPVGTDAMLGAAAAATATDIQTLGGSLRISVVAPDDASARASGQRFRALSGSVVTPGKMWLRSDGG